MTTTTQSQPAALATTPRANRLAVQFQALQQARSDSIAFAVATKELIAIAIRELETLERQQLAALASAQAEQLKQ